jgi:hypothetical protein
MSRAVILTNLNLAQEHKNNSDGSQFVAVFSVAFVIHLSSDYPTLRPDAHASNRSTRRLAMMGSKIKMPTIM